MRSLLAWSLMITGAVLTAYGLLIEIEIRTQIGTGLQRMLAHVFHGGTIRSYRETALLCVVVGPILATVGFFCRRPAA
ncbi:MAG: hypothetical protein ACOCVS_00960 [Planctomycetota bacterium]